MSHTFKANIIVNHQEMQLFDQYDIDIHDIITIVINDIGQIIKVVTTKASYTKEGRHPLASENDICQICKEKVDNYAGDPTKWGICLPHTDERGKLKTYHMGCVTEAIAKGTK